MRSRRRSSAQFAAGSASAQQIYPTRTVRFILPLGAASATDIAARAGLVAPAGTPPAIVTRLNGALRKIIDSPDVQAKFKNVGFEGFSSTPDALGDYIKAQLIEWRKMVKDADIQPD